jgi:hypothetical protein
MPFSIWHPRYALRQRDSQASADLLQLGRVQRGVGIADPPELFRVAQVMGGDIVQPIALLHQVLLYQRKSLWCRHKAPPQMHDRAPIGQLQLNRLQAGVAAIGREIIVCHCYS